MAAHETPVNADDAVRRSSYLRGLSDAARRDAAGNAKRLEFAAGGRLAEQGAPARALLLVASGLVRGSVFANDVEEVLHQAGPGSLLGATVLDDRSESMSWVAESNVVAFAWDREALAGLERAHPGVSAQLRAALGLRERTRELVTAIHHSPLFRHTSPVLIAELVRRSTLVHAPPTDSKNLVVRGDADLASELDVLSERRELDYVLCFAESRAEPRVSEKIRPRTRRAMVLTEDASEPLPPGAVGHDVLSWVEVRGPAWKSSARSRIRRGTVPVPLPVGRGELATGATQRRSDVRAEFARLARALTDRTVGVALGGGAAWVVAETKLDAAEHRNLSHRVREALKIRGIAVDQVRLVEPGALPKTTSGKIQRTRVRDEVRSTRASTGAGSTPQ